MGKQRLQKPEYMSVELEGNAEEAVGKLAQFIADKKEEGWTNLRLSIEGGDPDYGDGEIILSGMRPETEKEYIQRQRMELASAERQRIAKQKKQDQELKELARLKAKYENGQ